MFKKKLRFDEYDLSENDYDLLMKIYEGNLNDFIATKNSTIEDFKVHIYNESRNKESEKQNASTQNTDTSILEQKIKELEAENAELKNRTNAFTYNGVAPQENDAAGTNAFNDENVQLADENRKLSEAKANLQEKNTELYKQVQVLQQKLSQNGENRMSEEVTQWEHKHVSDKIEDNKLNELGKDGWELIGATPTVQGGSYAFMLKRPVKKTQNEYDYSR